MSTRYDLVVAGAGIVGLAHALAAARRGLRVAVVERDARASRSSVQNFGFVTISGQAGEMFRRARRSVEVWREVAAQAGIEIRQRGALVVARRPEALAVLEEFLASPYGEGCERIDAAGLAARFPMLREGLLGGLWSPHELRIEARDALPRLAAWIERAHGVRFHWGTAVTAITGSGVAHAGGAIEADAVVVAAGADVAPLAPRLAARANLRHCMLQMLRLAAPGWRLPGVVMADLSLLRYEAFATQPAAAALRSRLERECGRELDAGVHLIVAQGEGDTLVVGDSHRYAPAVDNFATAEVESMLLDEMRVIFRDVPPVAERWVGSYPVADMKPLLRDAPHDRTRIVTVTSGTGMSTGFAIGEETIAELFGPA